MINSPTQITGTTSAAPAPAARTGAANAHPFSFHDFLSAMNPLQYLPVVGTIYRAITGDVVSEPVREGGSLLVSGLLGGPIGLITNIATTIVEKITGIDPEKIIAAQFHRAPPPAVAQAGAAPTGDAGQAVTPTPVADMAQAVTPTPIANVAQAATPAFVADGAATPTQLGLTRQQLAAYGVHSDASGNLSLGDIQGADVLNRLELVRLDRVAAAYAANQAMPPTAMARGA
jgi:hypothetical protein